MLQPCIVVVVFTVFDDTFVVYLSVLEARGWAES